MKYYIYKARDINNCEIRGSSLAYNEDELIRELRDYGYYLTMVRAQASNYKLFNKEKFKPKDLCMFCKQFSTLLAAGMQISDILIMISGQLTNKKMRFCTVSMERAVRRGEELSSCMESFKDIFPEYMIQMIKVGELSCNLEYIFKSLYLYYSRESKMHKKLSKAMTYPIMLLVITIFVLIILMAKVVPSFVDTLVSLGGNIPESTKIVIGISNLFQKNFLQINMAILISVVFIKAWVGTISGKAYIEKLKARLPLFKSTYRKIFAVKFTKSMSIFLKSGMSVMGALEILKGTFSNIELQGKIQISIDSMKKGESFTDSVFKMEMFSDYFFSMIKLGEESSNLDEMLDTVADVLDEELLDSIEKITILIEPTMIIFISIIIGGIVSAIILPMFNMANAVNV